MYQLDLSTLSFDGLLEREWLAVNHLGGYAASTIPGCNTRRYHGLLVAAMSPPVRHMVMLSRVEETLLFDGWPHALACNEYPGTVHPTGHTLLRAFSMDPFPRWAYQNSGWTLEKQLRMLKGENTVVLSYTLEGAARPVELEVRPLFALRGFHELMYQWNGSLGAVALSETYHSIRATHRTPEVFFAHDGKFVDEGYWYLNTIYRREPERGYSGLEDLWSCGLIRFTLQPGQTARFVCSTEPIDFRRACEESERQYRATSTPAVEVTSTDEAVAALEQAAGQFAVTTRDGGAMLATGYPWSAPNGRDAMIGLPGLLLVPGRFAEARAVLEQLASLVRHGLMPSEFPGDGQPPRYEAADTSLWFVNALWQYLRYTGDQPTAHRLFEVVDEILTNYEKGTALNIKADPDGLLLAGSSSVPVTWMNAQINGTPITPRNGRAVELQALWHNALRIGAELARRFHHTIRGEELFMLANRCRLAFNRRFWNTETGCCHDVVHDHWADGSVRPNQVLAVSLPFPVMGPERFEAVLTRVREELLTPFGLRTLSPRDSQYRGRYGGPIVARDRAYHQGSAFPWLLGPFISAMVRTYGSSPATRQQAAEMLRPCMDQLRGAGLGQIHELFDGDAPHRAGGLTASARSIAEILRAYVEDVLDLSPVPHGSGQSQRAEADAAARMK